MASGKIIPGEGSKKLQAAIDALASKRVKVGWFESSKYPDGTPVAYVAAIQELGYGPIPPRPTLRPTAIEQKPEWSKLAARGAKAILNGADAGQMMETIGLKAAGDVAKAIASLSSPPLKEKTVKARMGKRADKRTVGSLTKPLVDTAILVGSLSHVVEDK